MAPMNGKTRWFKRRKPADEEERVESVALLSSNDQGSDYTLSTGVFETCTSDDTNRQAEMGERTKMKHQAEANSEGIEVSQASHTAAWHSADPPMSVKIPDQYHGAGIFLEHFDEPETALLLVSPGSGTIQRSTKGVISSLQGLHDEQGVEQTLFPTESTPLLPAEEQTFIDTALWVFWEYVLPPRARTYLSTHWSVSALLAVSVTALAVYLLHRTGHSRLASTIVLSVMCGLEMIFWGRDELGVCSGMRGEQK